ncbi:histidine kinase, partial [Pseudomonas sp. SIMBA_068]
MKRMRRLLVIGCLWLPLIALARPEAVPSVALEPAQQQWLEAHRSLRVGLVLQAPYAQFDRRLQQLYGANVELVDALAQALRLDLT